MTEKEILEFEVKQVHAQAVKEDARKRLRIRWELQAEDARMLAYLGAR